MCATDSEQDCAVGIGSLNICVCSHKEAKKRWEKNEIREKNRSWRVYYVMTHLIQFLLWVAQTFILSSTCVKVLTHRERIR